MSAESDTLEACLERIRSAWDAGDAAAYAEQFTEDAMYVIFAGMPLMGRPEIERMHVDVLARGTRMRIKVLSQRLLTGDVAVVLTAGGIGNGATIPYDKLQTLTLVRTSERWLCAAFQNTEMSPQVKLLHNREA